MIYQKPYSSSDGLIMVDVVIAFALAIMMLASIGQLSSMAREIFQSSKEKSRLADVFLGVKDMFEDMKPFEKKEYIIKKEDAGFDQYATTTIRASAKWYGNDRVEIDVTVHTDSEYIDFVMIEPAIPGNSRSSGSPLCSVDFSNSNTVGSYQWRHGNLLPDEIRATVSAIPLPVDPSLAMTDIEVRNGIAYISTDTSRQSDPDLLVFGIKNLSDPQLLSGINTGPGISSIALAGNRIFASVTSRIAQLQSIRLADLLHPIIETSYKIPLPDASTTSPLASSIFYDTGIVYLGTEKWDGDELSIIDVGDPATPKKLGGFETGSKINSIFVRGSKAFVADSDEMQLRTIDITDKANPTVINQFNPSGWQRQDGKSLSYFEGQLDFGRTSGGFNIKQDHELFGWSTSSVIDGSESPDTSVDVPGGVYGILRDRSFVYVISKQEGRELQIFDNSMSTTTESVMSLPVLPQAITCDNDKIYVLGSGNPIIYQITLSRK